MFWTIVLWALGAFLLFWLFVALLALPKGIGALVDRGIRRKPPESPLKKFVDEHERHRAPRGS